MVRIRVEQSDPPQTKEVLADAIVKIGAAADALHKSGLNEEAIIVLLASKTGVTKTQIRRVLQGLRQLQAWYAR